MRAVGKEIGARYVMEGSLRQAGSVLRVAVQLVDASTGAHLWAETYDRPFRPEEIFELQDDLVPRIVSTVADSYGVLPHSMSEALRQQGLDELTPTRRCCAASATTSASLRRSTPQVRAGLERAVQQAPGPRRLLGHAVDAVRGRAHGTGSTSEPDPLGRALQAARRAVEAAPSNHVSPTTPWPRPLFFRKEFPAFRNRRGAGHRAQPHGRSHGRPTWAPDGLRRRLGARLRPGRAGQAAQPTSSRLVLVPRLLRRVPQGRLPTARWTFALKINMPGYFYTTLALAAVYGQLGERDAAGKALESCSPCGRTFPARRATSSGSGTGRTSSST